MRSFKRVMCSLGGEDEYRRKVAASLPVSPQDDHVIEFAKQFGWDSMWLEKQQPKKRGKRQVAEQAASRASVDVGEMLASRASGSCETTSQVVQPDAAHAPQVKAAPPAPPVQQAAPVAPPVKAAPIIPLVDSELRSASYTCSCADTSTAQPPQGKIRVT